MIPYDSIASQYDHPLNSVHEPRVGNDPSIPTPQRHLKARHHFQLGACTAQQHVQATTQATILDPSPVDGESYD